MGASLGQSASLRQVAGPRPGPVPAWAIPRPRLDARLDAIDQAAMLVVSAPAGYGKSVALAQWARRRGPDVRWLVVGPRHHPDPSAAFASLPSVAGALRDDGGSSAKHDASAVPQALAGHSPLVVVVDDGRTGAPDPWYAELASAVLQAPECGLRVVVVSRSAPPAALAHLRVQGFADVLDHRDLAFTETETADLLEAMGCPGVDEADVRRLHRAHDGWPAGIAMAARAWARRSTSAGRPGDPAADDGLEDYFATVVLDGLPPGILAFLGAVAELPVLSARLCDRVLGSTTSEARLTWLRRRGVFLLPSERGRGWWRLHPQFRAAVLATFGLAGPRREQALGRAARWLAEEGLLVEAATCWAALRDWEHLSDLVRAHWPELYLGHQLPDLAAAVSEVPVARDRQTVPHLLTFALLYMVEGETTRAAELLTSIRPMLGTDDRMRADTIRVIEAGWSPEPAPFVALAEAALQSCDELGDDHDFHATEAPYRTDHYRMILRGLALTAGALAGAWDRVAPHLVELDAATSLELRPTQLSALHGQRGAYLALAGDSRLASIEATTALESAARNGILTHPLVSESHLALGEARRLAGHVDEAMLSLDRGLALSREIRRHNGIAFAVACAAHLEVDTGRAEAALARLAAHRQATTHRPPATLAGLLAAAECRAHGATGDVAAAHAALRQAPITAATASAGFCVALRAGQARTARAILDRWPDHATASTRLRRVLAVAALADAAGAPGKADAQLADATRIAVASDQVQPFVEFGAALQAPMLRLAADLPAHVPPEFLDRVQLALTRAHQPTSLPLSTQESRVLQHLGKGLTQASVAEEMHLSINTVKSHVRSIYRKLGVHTRTEALRILRCQGPSTVGT